MNNSVNLTGCGQNMTCSGRDVWLTLLVWECTDALLTLLTNSTTLFILCTNHLLETPGNILIGCLSLADLLSVLGLPFKLSTYYSTSELGWNISCVAYLLIFCSTALINCVSLCLIAVDRLIYVTYSLQYYSFKPVTKVTHAAYFTWSLSALFITMCIGLGYKYRVFADSSMHTPCLPPYSVTFASKMTICVPFYTFILTTIGIYIKIGLVARKQKLSIKAASLSQSAPTHDFKITKVILNVLVVYILCNLCIIYVPTVYYQPHLFPDYLQTIVMRVSVLLWQVNRWINPFIYAGKSRRFRRHVARLFTPSSFTERGVYTAI